MQKLKRKTILKEAGVLLIAAVMVLSAATVTANTKETNKVVSKVVSNIEKPVNMGRGVLFEDGFETYDDWLIDFPPWTTIDVNGDPTFSHSAHTWPHATDPYAFIIFNPSTTTPPMTDPESQPHSGDKYCAGFNNDNAGYTNDDWLISPQIGPGDYDAVTFWAKSYLDTYNYELFEVSVSTTDTDPASFTVISPVEQPGHTAWEEFTYNLDAYDGESIYIGIHQISIDSWFLMIDDFVVTRPPLIADANGPYEASEDEPIQFQGSAEGGVPPYSFHWDFDDGETSDIQNPMHTYTNTGNYTVTLTVTDDESDTESDTTWALIYEPPSAPDISGTEEGKPGESYSYYFTSTDPDGDDVSYFIDWGDGSVPDWTPYRTSGALLKEDHEFSEYGTFIIKAKAKDIYGSESDWAELSVAMPRNRAVNTPFLNFLESHPILYQLLLRFLRL